MATCLDLARDRFMPLALGNGYRLRPHPRSLYAPNMAMATSTSLEITHLAMDTGLDLA